VRKEFYPGPRRIFFFVIELISEEFNPLQNLSK
jgi:hypothetical protein